MSQKDTKSKRSRLSLKKRKSDNGGKTGIDGEKAGGSSKTPNILDFLSRQKQGRTAACPVCTQNILLSKMNQHLDSGCLATKEGCQATSEEKSLDDTDSPDVLTLSNHGDRNECDESVEVVRGDKYDRTVKVTANKKQTSKHPQSTKCEVTKLRLTAKKKELNTTATGAVSPYFKQRNQEQKSDSKKSTLKLKKKALSFSVTSSDACVDAMTTDSDKDKLRRSKDANETVGKESKKSKTLHKLKNDANTSQKSDTKKESCLLKSDNCDLDNPASKPVTDDSTDVNHHLDNIDSLGNTSLVDTSNNLQCELDKEEIMDFEASDSISTTISERVSTPSIDSSFTYTNTDSIPNTPSTSQDDSSMPSSQNTTEEKEEQGRHQPYYLANFFLVMNTVLENEEDRNLFNEEDMSYIDKFKNLSEEAQKLYVRLYQRKSTWLRVSKLDYPKIAEDMTPVAAELVADGFLHTERELSDLEETLHLMQAPDLKTLAKSLKVTCSGMQRGQIITALLKHGKQQRSLFGGLNSLILKRAKKSLGACVKLVRDVKAVFTRLLLLFSLTNVAEEEDVYASGGQSLLSMLFLSNYGRVVYEDYKIYRPTVLFRSRDDFLQFQVALQYESDIHSYLGNNDLEGALQIYQDACQQHEPIKQDPEMQIFHTSLPMFLRCYTTSWIYTRILGLGVEILQKMRRYGEAVEKLRELLSQKTYCLLARGRWWERLALNLDQHLKKPSKSLDAIKEALSDCHVRTGHRLALEQRVYKICESPSNVKLKKRLEEFEIFKVPETPKVVISGHIKQNDVVKERFYVIKKSNEGEGDEEILTPRVEDYVLHHYKQNGYNQGLHGEGSTFTTLIGLLAWDIVFAEDIPDVFRYSFQTAPLDMRTDDFYINRQYMIDNRLDLIMQSSIEDLHCMIEECWETHQGKQCTLVNWELFNDLGHVKGLVSCMGGKIISGIGRRILTDHRHCRGGVPDLVVWNTDNNTFKIVEVKGPNDRLAHKQILWIDYLNTIGATAEVCHVTAVGGKKLKAYAE